MLRNVAHIGLIIASNAFAAPAAVPRSEIREHGHGHGHITPAASAEVRNDEPCLQVAKATTAKITASVDVGPEIAKACMDSIQLVPETALEWIDSVKRLAQFQSTLDYVKDETRAKAAGFPGAIDIIGDLDDLARAVNNGEIKQQYEVESQVSQIYRKLNDGHFRYEAYLYNSIRWQRPSEWALASIALDSQLPKVYLHVDVLDGKTNEVVEINGEPTANFLKAESELYSYQDEHARYNNMFAWMAINTSKGRFVKPGQYPGKDTTLKFANGTTLTRPNLAFAKYPIDWTHVVDSATAYSEIVTRIEYEMRGTLNASEVTTRITEGHQLFNFENDLDDADQDYVRRADSGDAELQLVPIMAHDDDTRVPLRGYFLQTSSGNIGILEMRTFFDDTHEMAVRVGEFLRSCQDNSISRLIIDLRSNDGGSWQNLWPIFRAFFPALVPNFGLRCRAHPAITAMGPALVSSQMQSYVVPALEMGPLYHTDGRRVITSSWNDMYGPDTDHFGLAVSNTLIPRPPPSSDEDDIAAGPPFAPPDITLLSDGRCSSSCALFVELMTQQVGSTSSNPSSATASTGSGKVHSVFVNGLPELTTSPPPLAGGTKGRGVTHVSGLDYVTALADVIISESERGAATTQDLLTLSPIARLDAMVNWYDVLRPQNPQDDDGSDDDSQDEWFPASEKTEYSIPTQMIRDAADCRIVLEGLEEYSSNAKLWARVAALSLGPGSVGDGECLPNAAA